MNRCISSKCVLYVDAFDDIYGINTNYKSINYTKLGSFKKNCRTCIKEVCLCMN